MACLQNKTNLTSGNLTLLGNSTTEEIMINSTKILFCRSKGLFFNKIYSALQHTSKAAGNK